MERRWQNLTPLQRHVLALLARPRQGQGQPWLSLEPDCVIVEPLAQVLRGRVALVAARGLKAMGWLRARPGGGLELALAAATVAAVLEGERRPQSQRQPRWGEDRDGELDALVEHAIATCLTLSGSALRPPLPQA